MPNLIRCPNGHFYDFDRTSQCPYCPADVIYPPIPPDCPGEEEFMRRLAEREAAERALGVTAEVPAPRFGRNFTLSKGRKEHAF